MRSNLNGERTGLDGYWGLARRKRDRIEWGGRVIRLIIMLNTPHSGRSEGETLTPCDSSHQIICYGETRFATLLFREDTRTWCVR